MTGWHVKPSQWSPPPPPSKQYEVEHDRGLEDLDMIFVLIEPILKQTAGLLEPRLCL